MIFYYFIINLFSIYICGKKDEKKPTHHLPCIQREEKRERKKVLLSLQIGHSSKNLPFSPRNQKNFHSHQERKITRRLWGARISSWI